MELKHPLRHLPRPTPLFLRKNWREAVEPMGSWNWSLLSPGAHMAQAVEPAAATDGGLSKGVMGPPQGAAQGVRPNLAHRLSPQFGPRLVVRPAVTALALAKTWGGLYVRPLVLEAYISIFTMELSARSQMRMPAKKMGSIARSLSEWLTVALSRYRRFACYSAATIGSSLVRMPRA